MVAKLVTWEPGTTKNNTDNHIDDLQLSVGYCHFNGGLGGSGCTGKKGPSTTPCAKQSYWLLLHCSNVKNKYCVQHASVMILLKKLQTTTFIYGQPLFYRDGSKSFFASPSQVTSHFLASPSQVTSHFLASPSQVTSHLVQTQVKSQVSLSKYKSSRTLFCPAVIRNQGQASNQSTASYSQRYRKWSMVFNNFYWCTNMEYHTCKHNEIVGGDLFILFFKFFWQPSSKNTGDV